MLVVCKQSVDLSTRKKTDTLPKEDEIILCAFCNNPVTDPSRQIIVNNSFHHTFANPHGYVFEIGCFSNAKGCVPGSIASSEFSWFIGYSWKIGVCNYCSSHLGWIFSSKSNKFFGLILEKLIFP
ncbi:MAG: hypothetical protein K8S18_05900 [Desulfobacula sp.]|nr:hypothetical protein [Desulfobacula sp.]